MNKTRLPQQVQKTIEENYRSIHQYRWFHGDGTCCCPLSFVICPSGRMSDRYDNGCAGYQIADAAAMLGKSIYWVKGFMKGFDKEHDLRPSFAEPSGSRAYKEQVEGFEAGCEACELWCRLLAGGDQ